MARTPRGYHLVGHHLVYAVLEDASRRLVATSAEDGVSSSPGGDAAHRQKGVEKNDGFPSSSCSTFDALDGFLPAPVEVIFEGGGGGGGDLAVYVVTDVAGQSVTHRVSGDACF